MEFPAVGFPLKKIIPAVLDTKISEVPAVAAALNWTVANPVVAEAVMVAEPAVALLLKVTNEKFGFGGLKMLMVDVAADDDPLNCTPVKFPVPIILKVASSLVALLFNIIRPL